MSDRQLTFETIVSPSGNGEAAPPLEPKQSDESFIREMLAMAAAYLRIRPGA